MESLSRSLEALWGRQGVCFFSRRSGGAGFAFPDEKAYVAVERGPRSLEVIWNETDALEVAFVLGRAQELVHRDARAAWEALERARNSGRPALLVAPFPMAGPAMRPASDDPLLAPPCAPWRVIVGCAELRVRIPSGDGAPQWTWTDVDAQPSMAEATLALCDAWHDVPLATPLEECGSPREEIGRDALCAKGIARALSEARLDERLLESALARLAAHELSGDCYLANLTTRVALPGVSSLPGPAAHLARCAAKGVRFGAYVVGSDGDGVLLSSPERFVRTTADGHAFTEPIKGTRPSGALPALGEAQALWASLKETAELVLVTDLLRNDLNSVCEPGSVAVRAPFFVREAGGLLQMQSTPFGRLRSGRREPHEFLPSLLPAGSVSGTPKKRVREILATLEPEERGYYTGIVGWQAADGSFDSGVCIRSLCRDGRGVSVGVGAGITTLSEARAEIREFVWKLSSVRRFWEDSP